MRRMMLCLLVFATGCHNVIILSGGGFKPVMVPPTPELQCVVTALQQLTATQQHQAIRQCEEEEERRENNGKATSQETERSKTGEKGQAPAKDTQH